jgi:hypothetical protein
LPTGPEAPTTPSPGDGSGPHALEGGKAGNDEFRVLLTRRTTAVFAIAASVFETARTVTPPEIATNRLFGEFEIALTSYLSFLRAVPPDKGHSPRYRPTHQPRDP